MAAGFEDQINLDRILFISKWFYLKSIRQLTTFQQQQVLEELFLVMEF
jgi:hypothetical protein